MGMAAAFLLMADDGLRLAIQSQLMLGLFDGDLEGVDGNPFGWGGGLNISEKKGCLAIH